MVLLNDARIMYKKLIPQYYLTTASTEPSEDFASLHTGTGEQSVQAAENSSPPTKLSSLGMLFQAQP